MILVVHDPPNVPRNGLFKSPPIHHNIKIEAINVRIKSRIKTADFHGLGRSDGAGGKEFNPLMID